MPAPTILDVNLNTLIVGTTAISGGSSGRILYDNSGVVGEYTITGSGTVVAMQTDPSLLNTVTLTRTSIGATSADGIILTNTAAAAAGAQQYSPRIRLTGQGWKTNATAASQTADWIVENQPVQGSSVVKSALTFASQANGGGYTTRLQILDNGGTSAGFAQIYSPDGGSAASPAFACGATSRGMFSLGSTTLDFSANSTHIMRLESSNPFVGMGASTFFGWSSSTPSSDPDTKLIRGGAAATVQLGTNVNGAAIAQTLQACNGITGTDKTGADFTIQSGNGTGAGAVSSLIFKTPTVGSTGTTAQTLATRLTLSSSGASIVGGTTDTGSHTIESGTAIPAGGTAGKGYKLSSTSNFGVFFGSGAPTLAAAKGSLYLRSDGSTTNDRAYVNTDGSTTWTALTTVA